MSTIFSKIISREIPGHIIAENDQFIAFLDIVPLVMGHVLVVPKKEVDYIFDMDEDSLGGIHIFSKKVAHAIKKVVPCKRIGVAIIGLEVPHAHIHLIPMNTVGDINFSRPKLNPTKEELTEVAVKIRNAYGSA